ncbi:MAG: trimethylamine---corrinoid protein Co-methyltransferase, partial [Thermoleophilaceae bacterium]|nr:trimethylamine---corrinoid protein Co-methyltransferase [Thermoleophilaceae bacterium]
MYVNELPRYEILSEEAMDVLDRGWRRIVSELGVEFMLPEAVEYFRAAGQRVEGDAKVYLDPDFLLEQVAKAPREFDLQARNPANTIHIGGNHMAFAPVYGPPFVREGDVRRDAKMADFENFVKLSQSFPELDSPGGTVVEPEDRPLDSRHLDMVYALQTLSDKPYMGSVISAENARDTIAMGEILFGGADALAKAPVSISLINCNSPLRCDDRMLSAMLEYNR